MTAPQNGSRGASPVAPGASTPDHDYLGAAACGHACAPDDLTGGLCPSCADLDAAALAQDPRDEDTSWADLPTTCSFCGLPSQHFYDRYAACRLHIRSLAVFRDDDERAARRARETAAASAAVDAAVRRTA